MLLVTPTLLIFSLFQLVFNDVYPEQVPQVICLDRVYHPNIDPLENADVPDARDGNVCVTLLDDWDPKMDLDHIVMAILFLIYNPCVEDALSPYFDGSELDEAETFENNVRKTLRGESLDGNSWPRLLVTDDGIASENSDGDKTDNGASEIADAESRTHTDNSDHPEGGRCDVDEAEASISVVVESERSCQPSTGFDKDSESLPSTVCDDDATKLSNKESDDGAIKLSKIEVVYNRQNSDLTDLTSINAKGFHVIDDDGFNFGRSTSTEGANSSHISGLFRCNLGVGLGVKALFSNFWRKDGTFQTFGCMSTVINHGESDVD